MTDIEIVNEDGKLVGYDRDTDEQVPIEMQDLHSESVNTERAVHNAGPTASATTVNGGGQLGGERSLGRLPTEWTDEGVIYQDDALDRMVFPHIIEANRYLDNPLGKYYLFYSEYRGSGDPGIQLAYSDNILSGWTDYSGNPLFTTSLNGDLTDHVSSPWVLWDPFNSQFEMYFHSQGSSSGQFTARAVSSDGENWTYDQVILQKPSGSGVWDNSVRAYLTVYRQGRSRFGFYHGHGADSGGDGAMVGYAWAHDGDNWVTDDQPLFGGRIEGQNGGEPGLPKGSMGGIGGAPHIVAVNEATSTIDIGPWFGPDQSEPALVSTNLPFVTEGYLPYHGSEKLYLLGQDATDGTQVRAFSKKWGDLL